MKRRAPKGQARDARHWRQGHGCQMADGKWQMADVQMADVQMADVQMADVQMADVPLNCLES